MIKRAVIIDNDINESAFYDIIGSRPNFHLSVNNGQIETLCNKSNDLTHGTVCAAIFAEFAPPCEFGFISIMDYNNSMPVKNLLSALEWCIENDAKLICLSIGTENWLDLSVLAPYILGLLQKETIIVSATSNTGKISYPAALSGVIGVRCSNDVFGNQIYHCKGAKDGIDILANLSESKVLSRLWEFYAFPEIPYLLYLFCFAMILLKKNDG